MRGSTIMATITMCGSSWTTSVVSSLKQEINLQKGTSIQTFKCLMLQFRSHYQNLHPISTLSWASVTIAMSMAEITTSFSICRINCNNISYNSMHMLAGIQMVTRLALLFQMSFCYICSAIMKAIKCLQVWDWLKIMNTKQVTVSSSTLTSIKSRMRLITFLTSRWICLFMNAFHTKYCHPGIRI